MTFMTGSRRRTTMRAAVHTSYGSLEVRDVEVPTPGDGEVLVRVRAAGVDPGTWFTFTGRPYLIRLVMGLRRPRRPVLGRALAGEVAAVGSGVTSFRPGDEVYAELA